MSKQFPLFFSKLSNASLSTCQESFCNLFPSTNEMNLKCLESMNLAFMFSISSRSIPNILILSSLTEPFIQDFDSAKLFSLQYSSNFTHKSLKFFCPNPQGYFIIVKHCA
ncbi:hypothetical protein Avbf_14129 [Armadillidium vulgare]|nr:hypothetical protein Avbf_14129 [Armadillidium vulgare]